jgi:hypothetical protein
MKKFNTLNPNKLAIVDLAGLSNETIIAGNLAGPALGALGMAALNALINADSAFRANLITSKSSPLTKQIQEFDKSRDESFLEIRRAVSAAVKSSIPTNVEAGQKLEIFLNPYHKLEKEPILSETSTLNYLQIQFNSDPMLHNAAATLQLTTVFANLFSANEQVSLLWNQRAHEDAQKGGPSPSSLRNDLEKCYHNFCDVVIQSLNLQPSVLLEDLFSVMNEIRIKYAKSLPVKLTDANTSVDAIPTQKYTGQAITPIPRVFVKTEDNEFNELRFTVDFFVTYRNNTEVGEAKIIIHGKSKYSGSYTSTFHIEREY